jgi:hypothetical protein
MSVANRSRGCCALALYRPRRNSVALLIILGASKWISSMHAHSINPKGAYEESTDSGGPPPALA